MEIKRRFNLYDFRFVLALVYFVCFGWFLYTGLSPVDAINYDIVAEIKIPAIDLVSDVAKLQLKNHQLETPNDIVGSFSRAKNKTFLIGHSSTVFKNLNELKVGDVVFYDEVIYTVIKIETFKKEDINMNKLLSREENNTLILMTCAGQSLGNNDATHRLIITAEIE